MKAVSYLIILCCAFTPSMTQCVFAADAASPAPTSAATSPVHSFLETTRYFEVFELGFKDPWRERFLKNRTGERRAALAALIDSLARDIVKDPAFREAVYAVYTKHFTAAEFKTLEALYKSEAGSKIIKAQLTNTAPALSASEEQALNQFAATPFGKSLDTRMAKINSDLEPQTAATIDKHQENYAARFMELDR
jgi:hypothetical protein